MTTQKNGSELPINEAANDFYELRSRFSRLVWEQRYDEIERLLNEDPIESGPGPMLLRSVIYDGNELWLDGVEKDVFQAWVLHMAARPDRRDNVFHYFARDDLPGSLALTSQLVASGAPWQQQFQGTRGATLADMLARGEGGIEKSVPALLPERLDVLPFFTGQRAKLGCFLPRFSVLNVLAVDNIWSGTPEVWARRVATGQAVIARCAPAALQQAGQELKEILAISNNGHKALWLVAFGVPLEAAREAVQRPLQRVSIATDVARRSLVDLAAEASHPLAPDILRRLGMAGIDIDRPNAEAGGWAPLHFALQGRNWKNVRMLLELGADPVRTPIDNDGRPRFSPLDLARAMLSNCSDDGVLRAELQTQVGLLQALVARRVAQRALAPASGEQP